MASNNTDIKNKIVFITGASSGIGAATAKKFAKEGCQLILTARRVDRLNELQSQLTTEYDCKVLCYALDVRQREQVKAIIQGLSGSWKNIDILVNNAGLAQGLDKFQDCDLDDVDTMIETNISGLLYVTRCILPSMLENNQGHIINIGSIAGHQNYPGGTVYCATKRAVGAITEGLKLDLFGTPIRVTSIDPGLVETEFSQVRFKGDLSKSQKTYADTTPLQAEDIADAILYCAKAPAHVNISEMIVLATVQSGVGMIHRTKKDA